MSGLLNGLTDVAGSIAADVGDSYQDILLQDSPLGGGSSLEISDPMSQTEIAEAPWPGMSGETLGPEAEVSSEPGDYTALESGAVIDADYEEIPDAAQIEQQPDMDAPDIDA